ncbi:hypothetical protein [Rhizomonospora bruguierae]|uniref:hypothetical protein n=1 Tax=Rhizomonospora bruguierae TaxID=1581705 RepID=UPI001BCFF48E|nr:hypothetical protein [Micromonospora sp. NBRC 107566]
MRRLAEQTLTAIGRMTVAATELEYVLAWIAADQVTGGGDRFGGTAGGDARFRGGVGGAPAALFSRPGEPLRAARRRAELAPPACRDQHVGLVEGAATQLARGQAALRALWREDGGRTDPAVFDEITDRLLRCRDALHTLVQMHADGTNPA